MLSGIQRARKLTVCVTEKPNYDTTRTKAVPGSSAGVLVRSPHSNKYDSRRIRGAGKG